MPLFPDVFHDIFHDEAPQCSHNIVSGVGDWSGGTRVPMFPVPYISWGGHHWTTRRRCGGRLQLTQTGITFCGRLHPGENGANILMFLEFALITV